MKIICMPAGTTNPAGHRHEEPYRSRDIDIINKIAECLPSDTEWATQVAMAPHADFSDPVVMNRMIRKAGLDADRLAAYTSNPYILLDHEIAPSEKPYWDQAVDYRRVAEAARLRFGDEWVMGAYQVPVVNKNSVIIDWWGQAACLAAMDADWICPSTYLKLPTDDWRDISEVVEASELFGGTEVVPYVSGLIGADEGQVVPLPRLIDLRHRLEALHISRVILWIGIGAPNPVESAQRIGAIFGRRA